MQLIFDAHLDMAWNAVEWNRDLTLPVGDINKFESQFSRVVPEIGDAVVSWQELRRGRVGMTISTLLPRLHRKDGALSHYQSREAAYGACYGQMAYYRAMVEAGHLRQILDLAALEDHVSQWNADQSGEASTLPIGFILSMEGSPSILSPGQIEEWYNAGLRILGPAQQEPRCCRQLRSSIAAFFKQLDRLRGAVQRDENSRQIGRRVDGEESGSHRLLRSRSGRA